jgi:hypothetical protein
MTLRMLSRSVLRLAPTAAGTCSAKPTAVWSLCVLMFAAEPRKVRRQFGKCAEAEFDELIGRLNNNGNVNVPG